MVVKVKFRKSPPFLVSYNWIDIADGTGVIQFYAFTSEDTSTIDHHLSAQVLTPSIGNTTGNTTDADWTLQEDIDFDLTTFNITKTIEGTAVVNFPLLARGTGSGSFGSQVYVIVKIRKWDGTTETDLATAQTDMRATGTSASNRASINLQMPITKTVFNRGDTLRLTIEIWARRVGGSLSIAIWEVGHDPLNRDQGDFVAADYPTPMILSIPFKIET